MVYDAAGKIIAQSGYTESTTEPIRGTKTIYDDAGRVAETQARIGMVIDIIGTGAVLASKLSNEGTVLVGTTTKTKYDSAGRPYETTDGYGRKTVTTYNAKGSAIETRT